MRNYKIVKKHTCKCRIPATNDPPHPKKKKKKKKKKKAQTKLISQHESNSYSLTKQEKLELPAFINWTWEL